MLFYDSVVTGVSGGSSLLGPQDLQRFEQRLTAAGVPYRRDGSKLAFAIKE